MASSTLPIPRKLWEHPNPKSTQMYKFKTHLERQTGRSFPDFQAMYGYSCAAATQSDFWLYSFAYFPLVYAGTPPRPCFDAAARMDSVPRWFRGVHMNFAENILFHGDGRGNPVKSPGKEDDKVACTGVREGSFLEPMVHVTWKELRQRVGRMSNAMRARGVQKGDRVAIVASNSIDSLVVFLGVTALGGLFSSSSTDMGVKGVLDRLQQIEPQWLFMDDWAVYNGKTIDLRPKITEIVTGMKGVSAFKGVVSQCRFPGRPADVSQVPRAMTWDEYLSAGMGNAELTFERVEFCDPFLVVYSSGTTGQPKCIVHSVGGVILNAHKEGRLHRCLDEHSVHLQYTTTGWIMYSQAVQSLLFGACTILYDGSPFVPDIRNFITLCGSSRKVTHLGISPRYLQELDKNHLAPRQITDLSNLQVVTSTGMVLSDHLFTWFYDVGFPAHVQLDNISGGTDIAGAFGTGNPILPVYVGGCQSRSLGTPVEVYDSSMAGGRGVPGRAVPDGTPGDLVATRAFPNMPVGFWGTHGPTRYFHSYFARFDNVWTHGDCILVHPATKNVVFLGRADGVLNPSGVRFGSAEIYSVVDSRFGDRVQDSICVGQRRPGDTDESVMLFLLMKPGEKFTRALVGEVKRAIRREMSPRHVPKWVFETPDIPTTVNLKKVELPVKQIVSGEITKPSGTLFNPQSLDYYYQFAKVEELVDQANSKSKAKL